MTPSSPFIKPGANYSHQGSPFIPSWWAWQQKRLPFPVGFSRRSLLYSVDDVSWCLEGFGHPSCAAQGSCVGLMCRGGRGPARFYGLRRATQQKVPEELSAFLGEIFCLWMTSSLFMRSNDFLFSNVHISHCSPSKKNTESCVTSSTRLVSQSGACWWLHAGSVIACEKVSHQQGFGQQQLRAFSLPALAQFNRDISTATPFFTWKNRWETHC